MKRTSVIIILLLACAFVVTGQLVVDFPIENGIYQRKQDNTLDILITGRYTDTLTTSIEARLVNDFTLIPIPGFNWQSIDALPQLGNFRTVLKDVPGGRYNLQVRNLNGVVPLDTFEVSYVGVGEVFMISGQSNASGYQDFGSISSLSNDVVTHDYGHNDYHGGNNTTIPPTFPNLGKIDYDDFLSLKGNSSWCYGRLGDLLLLKLRVPVAFFNGASEGTTSENWRASSLGQPTNQYFTGTQYGGLVGMPYLHFRMTMNYYASQFGARANLWHQGEGDTIAGTASTTYRDNLNTIIAKSREHFDPNLSWVVSRASYTGRSTSPEVIGGQNLTVIGDNNAFYGPETDHITFRDPEQGIHFFGSSLIDLANEWNLELDANFFQNSSPVLPKPVQEIKVRFENGLAWLIAPPNYSSYRWIDVTNGNKNYEQTPESTKALIKKVSGKYMCYLTEANGNIVPSQIIDVTSLLNLVNKNPAVCESVTYLSDLRESSLTGEFKKDQSQQSTTLSIDDEQFTKGLGAHSYFKITYTLPANTYNSFKTFIGIDDSVTPAIAGSHDGVIYKVYGDDPNNPIYSSPILKPDSPIQYIDLPINNYSSLTLEVEEVGNIVYDHADWADAKLTKYDTTPPVISIDRAIINAGQTINLTTTTTCDGSNSIRWSDGKLQAVNSITPQLANEYFATCVNTAANCQSLRSNIVAVTILKNCESSYTFASPTNDLSNPILDLTYKVSETIDAANKLQNSLRVNFNAAKSITLSPGFLSDSGTTFTAEIGGCVN